MSMGRSHYVSMALASSSTVTTSGRFASTASRAVASGARCISPWIRRPRTPGRESSPPAETVTVRSGPSFRAGSLKTSRSAPFLPTALMTRGCARSGLKQASDPFPRRPSPRCCHAAIAEWQAVPIRKTGRAWKEDCPPAKARNETLRATKRYGHASWRHWTGYHARSRIDTEMPLVNRRSAQPNGRVGATWRGTSIPRSRSSRPVLPFWRAVPRSKYPSQSPWDKSRRGKEEPDQQLFCATEPCKEPDFGEDPLSGGRPTMS